jgi:HK97 gp10 family phage protein
MASSVTIRVEGLRALGERMKTMRADMAVKAARAATAAGAGVIKAGAKRRAPIADEPYTVRAGKGDKGVEVQPRNLPKNIITKRIKSQLTSEHIVTVRGKRKDGYAKRIGILQEFGTAHAAAQPFMRPAFDEDKQAAIQAMRDRLEKRIKKAGA